MFCYAGSKLCTNVGILGILASVAKKVPMERCGETVLDINVKCTKLGLKSLPLLSRIAMKGRR